MNRDAAIASTRLTIERMEREGPKPAQLFDHEAAMRGAKWILELLEGTAEK